MNTKQKNTESRNPLSENIDTLSTKDMIQLFNNEDKKVAYAVEKELDNIAEAVDEIYLRLKDGGRLFYCGAGTSGRLGILDASECPPTFSVSPELVQGLIAGGEKAVFSAVEGAEDSLTECEKELKARNFSERDCLVGLAASGTTPYVIGGLKYAKSIGSFTASISCNEDSDIAHLADVAISPVVGSEVITGSTRLKAGTAEKMVLNMISTGVMVKLGKVYGNLMVDLQVSNTKLADRAIRIVSTASDVDRDKAKAALDMCNGEVKTAIVTLKGQCNTTEARSALEACSGNISRSLLYVGSN